MFFIKVAQWKHLDLRCLAPTEWGWRVQNDLMEPIKTDLEPAPEWLLNVIRCNCKETTRKPCGSRLCSCRKNGLHCVPACGGCHGKGCENAELLQEDTIAPEHESDLTENERNIFDIFEDFL